MYIYLSSTHVDVITLKVVMNLVLANFTNRIVGIVFSKER